MFSWTIVGINRTLEAFAREPNGGLIATNNPKAMAHRGLIATLAARHRLPAVYPARVYVTSGGLMSYGIDPVDPYRGAASYVDRILRGEKPEDMPVQQPTKARSVNCVNTRCAPSFAASLVFSTHSSLVSRASAHRSSLKRARFTGERSRARSLANLALACSTSRSSALRSD